MHFTRHSVYESGEHVPVIVKGEGAYIWDDRGRRYFDGLSGLFTVMLGHGRTELADAAAAQARELAFFPVWSYAHPAGDQPGGATGRARARRSEPGLLHHRGW